MFPLFQCRAGDRFCSQETLHSGRGKHECACKGQDCIPRTVTHPRTDSPIQEPKRYDGFIECERSPSHMRTSAAKACLGVLHAIIKAWHTMTIHVHHGLLPPLAFRPHFYVLRPSPAHAVSQPRFPRGSVGSSHFSTMVATPNAKGSMRQEQCRHDSPARV